LLNFGGTLRDVGHDSCGVPHGFTHGFGEYDSGLEPDVGFVSMGQTRAQNGNFAQESGNSETIGLKDKCGQKISDSSKPEKLRDADSQENCDKDKITQNALSLLFQFQTVFAHILTESAGVRLKSSSRSNLRYCEAISSEHARSRELDTNFVADEKN
jgi:hypothetical protein